jgi:protein gp37
MSLKEATGNMYEFVTHIWNPVKGRCPYGCSYCYVSRICKRFGREQCEPYLDERELRTDLGEGNTIFVCDSIDLFAPDIPVSWLEKVVVKTQFAPDNTYLWHMKNPGRATGADGVRLCPNPDYILCVTIESNIHRPDISRAPDPQERIVGIVRWDSRRMITVEPIMAFTRHIFASEIISCRPEQVNIGADSGHNGLPEPTPDELAEFIEVLRPFTKVHIKSNLKRLLPKGFEGGEK